jgi:hypothetical protein
MTSTLEAADVFELSRFDQTIARAFAAFAEDSSYSADIATKARRLIESKHTPAEHSACR